MKRTVNKETAKSSAPGIIVFIAIGAFICLALVSMQQESFGKVTPPELIHGKFHKQPLQKLTISNTDVDFDRFLRAIELVESHGNRNAISPKGARGAFQIMPATARKPGMGVKPLRNHSYREQKRFARDYLKALHKRCYGSWKLTAAAYNAGNHVCIAAGKWPKETRNYVKKVELAMNRR